MQTISYQGLLAKRQYDIIPFGQELEIGRELF
jgi:hypothetical protein